MMMMMKMMMIINIRDVMLTSMTFTPYLRRA